MKLMKSLFIITFISSLATFNCLDKKTRVMLIGVDGLFKYCLDKANHTSFDYLAREGSSTMDARTAIEAISGPGWSNILCGLDTEDSGIIDNNWVPPTLTRKYSPITPVSGMKLPCIFEELKKNKKDLLIKSSVAWDFLLYFGNQFNPNTIDEEKYCWPYDTLETTDLCDQKTADNAVRWIKEDFDFAFPYFGSVDETGHLTGFCSDRYIQQISKINDHIDRIISELKAADIYDDTYIILTTDHGASMNTTWHGQQNDNNLLIPWYIVGPNIKKGFTFTDYVRNYDTSPTIMKIFGFPPNQFWRGKSVDSAFNPTSEEFLK